MVAAVLALSTCATACAGRDANHIGAPWTWPGAAVSSGISNAVYDARRNRVKTFVNANLDAISAQARDGGGPMLDEGASIAGVPVHRRAGLNQQLRESHATFFDKPTREEAVEAVTIVFMVYSAN